MKIKYKDDREVDLKTARCEICFKTENGSATYKGQRFGKDTDWTTLPFVHKDIKGRCVWAPTINLDTHTIEGWPKGHGMEIGVIPENHWIQYAGDADDTVFSATRSYPKDLFGRPAFDEYVYAYINADGVIINQFMSRDSVVTSMGFASAEHASDEAKNKIKILTKLAEGLYRDIKSIIGLTPHEILEEVKGIMVEIYKTSNYFSILEMCSDKELRYMLLDELLSDSHDIVKKRNRPDRTKN